MKTSGCLNPIVEALRCIFKNNAGIRIFDYGDLRTFSDLWRTGLESEKPKIGGQQMGWAEGDTTILIVGVKPPNEALANRPECMTGIDPSDHLTSLSWAAAWRLRHPDSPVRLAIIANETSPPCGNTPSALATMFSSRGPADRPFVPRMAFLAGAGLRALVSWLGREEEKGKSIVWPTLPLLHSCIWQGLTGNRSDHHAISNISGAFLLAAQVGEEKKQPGDPCVQDYLLALAKACGVDTDAQQDCQCWISPQLQEQIGAAVLFDDMADLWRPFLANALGFTIDERRLVTIFPGRFFEEMATIPNRLTRFFESERRFLTANDFVVGKDKIDRFVLFLDLRLFPDPEAMPRNNDREKQRKKFFNDLAAFGIKLLDSGRHLPWIDKENGRRVLREELEYFLADLSQSELRKPKNKPLPPEETLFPRLLSLLDPTLPIVIFSSTHHSDLTDPFHDYGNIITTFRKPILNGMTGAWSDVVRDLKANFVSALNQAARILRVRNGMAVLKNSSIGTAKDNSANSSKAVEIFIDESFLPDDRVYSVGAVVLLAENHQSMRAFCRAMEAEGMIWGVSEGNRDQFVFENREPRFFNRNRLVCARGWQITNRTPSVYLPKRPTPQIQGEATTKIAELAQKHGVVAVAAVIGCPMNSGTGRRLRVRTLQGVSLTQTDELHRELTLRLIQFLMLAHPSVRNALNRGSCSVALDVAERTSKPDDYDERCERLFQQFGFRYSGQVWNDLTPEEQCQLWNQVVATFKKNGRLLHLPDKVSLNADGSLEPDQQTLERLTQCKTWRVGERYMFSVASHDGLGFLRAGLSALNPSMNPTIVRSRGVPLFDFDDINSWMIKLDSFPAFPYQIHYLADWIALAGALKIAHPERTSPRTLAPFFKDGFVEEWTPNLRQLLQAAARIEHEDLAGGVSDMIAWIENHGAQIPDASVATRMLLARGAEAADRFKGADLRALFEKPIFAEPKTSDFI